MSDSEDEVRSTVLYPLAHSALLTTAKLSPIVVDRINPKSIQEA